MGGRRNGSLLEKTERKLKSPLGTPRITEQRRRHGSSARYMRDPTTQGYRPGGACRSCGTTPRKLSRSPGPFLVVSHYTIWTHDHNPSNTSCYPWPPGQLGAGRLHYHRVCICVTHGKHCRLFCVTSCYFSYGSIFSRVVLGRPEPGLPPCSSRNSSRRGPLLSLISPPRPRFFSADLPNPCWSNPPKKTTFYMLLSRRKSSKCVVTFLWHLRWDFRVCTKPLQSQKVGREPRYMIFEAQNFLLNKDT